MKNIDVLFRYLEQKIENNPTEGVYSAVQDKYFTISELYEELKTSRFADRQSGTHKLPVSGNAVKGNKKW